MYVSPLWQRSVLFQTFQLHGELLHEGGGGEAVHTEQSRTHPVFKLQPLLLAAVPPATVGHGPVHAAHSTACHRVQVTHGNTCRDISVTSKPHRTVFQHIIVQRHHQRCLHQRAGDVEEPEETARVLHIPGAGTDELCRGTLNTARLLQQSRGTCDRLSWYGHPRTVSTNHQQPTEPSQHEGVVNHKQYPCRGPDVVLRDVVAAAKLTPHLADPAHA